MKRITVPGILGGQRADAIVDFVEIKEHKQ